VAVAGSNRKSHRNSGSITYFENSGAIPAKTTGRWSKNWLFFDMCNHQLRQYSTVSCHTGQVVVKVAVAGLIDGIGGSAVAGNDDVFFLPFPLVNGD
jgi:hypothetical protein